MTIGASPSRQLPRQQLADGSAFGPIRALACSNDHASPGPVSAIMTIETWLDAGLVVELRQGNLQEFSPSKEKPEHLVLWWH
jgi:hypothetical protein